jgi:chitosanase
MRIKLFLYIFFLVILVQPGLAINTNAKNSSLQMTTTLENSDTQLQFNYAENINDGRGITFGCIGFCTGTYDGNELIKYYTALNQSNILAKYIPALDEIDAGPHTESGSDGNPSVEGLSGFITDVQNCRDPLFAQAQLYELDQLYWNPAVSMWNSIGAKNALTLAFIYDMSVRHGADGAQDIINQATSALGGTPETGINENMYLSEMFAIRDAALKSENLGDADRDSGYKAILASGNVDLKTPFTFTSYGDSHAITGDLGLAVDTISTIKDSTAANFNANVTSSSSSLYVNSMNNSENSTRWNWDYRNETASFTPRSPAHMHQKREGYHHHNGKQFSWQHQHNDTS